MQYGEFCIPIKVWKRILKFRHWNVECGAELPESPVSVDDYDGVV